MKWSKNEEKEMIKYLNERKTYLDISIILNRTKRSVKEKVNRLGFSSKTFRVKTEIKKCLECEKEFEISPNNKREKNRKFCSSSCSTTFNNKLRTNDTIKKISFTLKNKIKKEKTFCVVCGNENSKSEHKFCSNKCQNEERYLNYIIEWKNNNVSGKSGENGISAHIRKFLFKKYDNKCSECGWSKVNKYTGNIPLEVEHIDGDSENNKEENLTLLCPSCHSLTKTYKGANRGNGRYNRRKRYQEGKSY